MVQLPPLDATFSLREAAGLAGVTLRTVRYYVAQRALPKVKAEDFKGADTRYDLSFVLRLRAIARLLPEMRRLEPILARFDAASPEERVRLAGFEPPPAPPPVDPPREEPSAAQAQSSSSCRPTVQTSIPSSRYSPSSRPCSAKPANGRWKRLGGASAASSPSPPPRSAPTTSQMPDTLQPKQIVL